MRQASDPLRGETMRRTLLLAALVAASPTLPAQTPSVRSAEHHIVVDGRQRSFLVDLPPGYDDRQRYPLVLDFHGGGGSPASARKQAGFSALGAREGVIVVYPAGSGRLHGTAA